MDKKNEVFKTDLKEIFEFLSNKKQLTLLAEICGTTLNTVKETFKNESFEGMKGKHLVIYENAIALINKIKSLPDQANDALNKN